MSRPFSSAPEVRVAPDGSSGPRHLRRPLDGSSQSADPDLLDLRLGGDGGAAGAGRELDFRSKESESVGTITRRPRSHRADGD
jgi:hypothetical protein